MYVFKTPTASKLPYQPLHTNVEANEDIQLFDGSPAGRANPGVRLTDGVGFGDGCQLTGISLGDDKYLANLGTSEKGIAHCSRH
jgi:hypothetical protein